MAWSKKQIEFHKEAARRLDDVVSEAFSYIIKNVGGSSSETSSQHLSKGGVTEYEVRELVLSLIRKQGMKVCDDNVIVAFGKNTQYVHYFPSQFCRKLNPGDLIMIDIWAALKKPGAPYADITRMGFFGKKMPAEYSTVHDLLVSAQDKTLALLKKHLKDRRLPTGSAVDAAARNFLKESMRSFISQAMGKYAKSSDINNFFRHTLGHSLGTLGPHGKIAGFRPKNGQPIKTGVGYTIEPGLYFREKFGMRSEFDIFIDTEYRLEITSKRHKDIFLI